MWYLKLLVIFTVVCVVLGMIIIFTLPDYRSFFVEDGLVENLSVLFYVLAFLIAIFRWITIRRDKRRPGWLPGVAALGLMGALEELSYGQRVFEFSVPKVAGIRFDTLHDIVDITLQLVKKSIGSNATFIIVVGAAFAGLLTWLSVRYGRTILARVRQSQPLLILCCLIILIGVAQLMDLVVDLGLMHLGRFGIFEEVFEMNAAFAILLLSLLVAEPVSQ